MRSLVNQYLITSFIYVSKRPSTYPISTGVGYIFLVLGDYDLIIDESKSTSTVTEIPTIVEILGKSGGNSSGNLEEEKRSFKIWLCTQVDRISSMEQLAAAKRINAPLEPTLNALVRNEERARGLVVLDNKRIPHNKKIPTQRCQFSTKKKNKSDKRSLKKPCDSDINTKALQLLHPQ